MNKSDIKYLRLLKTKKGRKKEGQFLAEGARSLEESVFHQFLPIQIFFAESMLNERSKKLILSFAEKKVPRMAVKAKEIGAFADTEACQGVVGLFKAADYDINKIVNLKSCRVLILDNLGDPGNAGTLIRSAVAFKFNAVICTPHAVEIYNPKLIRSTAGAIFAIPHIVMSMEEIEKLKSDHPIKIIGTNLKGKSVREQSDKFKNYNKLFLAIGSEADGLTPEMIAFCDDMVTIRHGHRVESLNAAVAGSILMKEIYDLNE